MRYAQKMNAVEEYAQRQGISVKQFSRLLLSAQRKSGTQEPMTAAERDVWRFATGQPSKPFKP